jgi:hypothetical protein
MKPPGEDLERRRPVWEALSRLFLDTDLGPEERGRIAATLDESGYSEDEVRSILWEELFPALRCNLAPVAGEWAGFDGDWLETRILSASSRATRISRWVSRMPWGAAAIVRREWETLVPHLRNRCDRFRVPPAATDRG